jgi:hypothetical protein
MPLIAVYEEPIAFYSQNGWHQVASTFSKKNVARIFLSKVYHREVSGTNALIRGFYSSLSTIFLEYTGYYRSQ